MITVEQFYQSCGCRSVGECHHNDFAEFKALDALVDAFAAEMKKKLRVKALQGRGGWDNPEFEDGIRESLERHVCRGKGQEIDIANLAAMLWNFGE